jgi:hypothetical protein
LSTVKSEKCRINFVKFYNAAMNGGDSDRQKAAYLLIVFALFLRHGRE